MKLAAFMVWTNGVGYARGVCEHCGNPQIFESRVPWTEEEARRVVESETCPICDRRTPRAAAGKSEGRENAGV